MDIEWEKLLLTFDISDGKNVVKFYKKKKINEQVFSNQYQFLKLFTPHKNKEISIFVFHFNFPNIYTFMHTVQ